MRCARMAVPCASVTVVDDASSPVQEETAEALRSMGAEYVQSSWERHGNLRGPDCIRGMLSAICWMAAGCAGWSSAPGARCTPPEILSMETGESSGVCTH